MHESGEKLYLAIDGGTTNTRVWLFRGRVRAGAAVRAVGVRDVAISGSRRSLQDGVKACVEEVLSRAGIPAGELDLACACGMLTSNVGLCEVPHVPAPAGIEELATHVVAQSLPEIVARPIYFVPGIKTEPVPPELGNLSHIDILRGEESEAMGILDATGRRGPLCILLPGSHTKLLHVDGAGRITASYTTMAGELTQAMAERTILADSIAWPPAGEPLWSAVEAGARIAGEQGLMRGGFAVRLGDVAAGLNKSECTWLFVGLVLGADLVDLRRWPLWPRDLPVLVGGREPVRSGYARILRTQWAAAAEPLDDNTVDLAAPRGALAVAQRYTALSSDSPGRD